MIFLLVFVTAALIVIALITIVNVLTFPRLKERNLTPQPPLHNMESESVLHRDQVIQEGLSLTEAVDDPTLQHAQVGVSVLIPARNEARVIGDTVRSLLAQEGVDLEVIVLDDQSNDGTTDAALAAAAGDTRLRVIAGQPLPAGWLGKNWACQQLALAAQHDALVFADADVRWQPGALRALLWEMERTRADLLTIWSTQETVTWGERLVVPLMALVVLGYLPVLLVHHTPWRVFAAANGQCLAFRRAAYLKIGGHAAVSAEIVEDITLARRIKGQGLRLRMADGGGLITCRMYRSWRSVRDGYAKNIIAGYGGSVLALGLATIFHWLIFFVPWLWLFTNETLWALALIVLGIGIRALTAAASRQRVGDSLWMPLSVLLMTAIALRALQWRWLSGGPQWKGRSLG